MLKALLKDISSFIGAVEISELAAFGSGPKSTRKIDTFAGEL
jgi:hypothetical protein